MRQGCHVSLLGFVGLLSLAAAAQGQQPIQDMARPAGAPVVLGQPIFEETSPSIPSLPARELAPVSWRAVEGSSAPVGSVADWRSVGTVDNASRVQDSAWRPVPKILPSGAPVVSTAWPVPGQGVRLASGAEPEKPLPMGPEKPTDKQPDLRTMPPADEALPTPKKLQPDTVVRAPETLAAPSGPPFPAGPPHVPHENNKLPLSAYIIEPPDVLKIDSIQKIRDQEISGYHLVRPDGSVGLGIYGDVMVWGMTLDQARVAIASQLSTVIQNYKIESLSVDVQNYNSKFYYVITDGGGYGEQVMRFPITGSETVLDAISQISGLPAVSSLKHIWVARAAGGHGEILPVDWCGVTQHGAVPTNYQLLPGDRVYVKAQKLVHVDSKLARILAPIERILGVTLLGSTTVNSIKGRNTNGN